MPINQIINIGTIASGILVLILLGACTGKANLQHPALLDIGPDTPVANIYFLRPRMLKPKGYSDSKLDITFNDKKLLELHAGAYTLLKVHPGKVRVATHSLTNFTNQQMPIKVSRYRDYNFIAGKTYFIHIRRVDEEFRGVFFDPQPIDLLQAKALLTDVTAFGLARYESIDELEITETDPESTGDMPPAFPEALYPSEKYILQPSPFK